MTTSHPNRRRRGAILLVVLAMLALFAVIGLSFVLFAESEGTAGRIYREDKSKLGPLDPADAAGRAIRQVVWGTDDVNSVARGHDLARLMYGELGEVPYNGVGTVHQALTIPGVPGTVSRAEVINHALQQLTPANKDSWVVVDSEFVRPDGQVRTGAQKYTTSAGDTLRAYELPQVLSGRQTKAQGGQYDLTGASGAGATFPFTPPSTGLYTYAAKNAPYTYVDRNNVMVGLTDPITGRVVMPSAHRPSLFYPAPGNTTLATATPDWFGDAGSNPNWTTPAGRFKILRPRPEDHKPAGGTSTFPYPPKNPDGSRTGDVQNLRFADGTQRNDSVWLDLNLPAVTDPRGRRLVPLVAPLMVPLDNRVNLNASGNLVAGSHQSAAGFGPHEINPAWLSALNTTTTLNPTAKTNAQAYTYNRFGATAVTTTPPTPAGVGALQFQPTGVTATPSVPAPGYAPVPWDGQATAAPVYPTGTQSSPDYSSAGYTAAAAAATSHPALWNAYERAAALTGDPAPTAGSTAKTYPVSDLKLFGGRYSDKQSTYTGRTYLANQNRSTAFLNEFLADSTGTYSGAGGTAPGAKGNLARSLVTPVSNSRAVVGTGYNWAGTESLTLAAGQATPTFAPAAAPVTSPQLDLTTLTAAGKGDGAGSAATTQAQARNLRAALGGVDLNRPLADYRTDVTQPLSSTNAGNSTQAAADRQALARDVFIRLAVATGAKIGYDPAKPDVPAAATDSYYGKYVLPVPDGMGGYTLTVGGTAVAPAPTATEYDALRWLAQLAANLVDFLDTDDVSTAFVWNPLNPLNPVDTSAANNSYDSTVSPAGSPMSQRVVFGTERPRLVLNEVYAEVANTQADASRGGMDKSARQPFPVRFFVELLNPATGEAEPTAGAAVHPLLQPLVINGMPQTTGSHRGSVPLHYGTEPTSCYRLVLTDDGNTARTDLQRADNVRGEVLTGTTSIKAVATLHDLAIDPSETMTNSTQTVEPNGGLTPAATGAAGSRNGFAVVGPRYSAVSGDVAFTPDVAQATWANFKLLLSKTAGPQTANQNPANAPNQLEYTVTGSPLTQDGLAKPTTGWLSQVAGATGRKHAVLLQRLVNPYLPFDANTNPYLTVDALTRVEVQDGVRYVSDNQGGRPTYPAPAHDAKFALGRVQPYAGDAGDSQSPQLADIGPGDLQTNTSLTVRQTSATPSVEKTTFFAHNSPGPTAGRFEWLAHLDRKLVSPAEVLFASAAKPHELTKQFGRPAATPLYHRHDIQHPADTASGAPAGPLDAANSPLYRALDVLLVKPWTVNTPLAGRQAGKVNVNFLFDGQRPDPAIAMSAGTPSKVFRAVMDPQAGNAFTADDVDAIWQNLLRSRSPGWVKGGTGAVQITADELGTNAAAAAAGITDPAQFDRPIKGLGTGLFGTSATVGKAFPTTVGTAQFRTPGLEDTLLRSQPQDAAGNPVMPTVTGTASNLPGLFQNPTAVPAGTSDHPLRQWEPLRKAFNNLTTTTDTYLLMLTVGYFEVVESDNGQPARILRAEAYDQAPGDLRAQFVAVLDRTNLGADANAVLNQTAAGTRVDQSSRSPLVLELQAPLTVPPDPVSPALRAATPVTIPGTVSGVAVTGTYDGADWRIGAGDQFFVGTGDAQNLMKMEATPAPVAGTAPGTVVIQATFVENLTAPNVALGTPRPHAAGEMVSNMRFRNPGPQPSRVLRPDRFDPVVRLFTELK